MYGEGRCKENVHGVKNLKGIIFYLYFVLKLLQMVSTRKKIDTKSSNLARFTWMDPIKVPLKVRFRVYFASRRYIFFAHCKSRG